MDQYKYNSIFSIYNKLVSINVHIHVENTTNKFWYFSTEPVLSISTGAQILQKTVFKYRSGCVNKFQITKCKLV